MTPVEIEQELQRLSSRLEGKSDAFAVLARQAAESEVAYKIAFAQSLLVSDKKTVAEREADSLVQCESEYTKRKIDEAVANACLESMRSIRDQLSACQSMLRSVRDEMKMA